MKSQEKRAKEILRRELGHFYKGQSFEDVDNTEFQCLSGFYLKTCHEENITLKSEVIMDLQIIGTVMFFEKRLKNPFMIPLKLYKDPYEALKSRLKLSYTGFTSCYVAGAIQLNIDLIPSIITELIDADEKRGTTVETILSRESTCLKQIDNGQFLNELLGRCSDEFVGLFKVWLDSLLLLTLKIFSSEFLAFKI